MNKELREMVIKRIKKDIDIIINIKMPLALDKDNDGTYRNLVSSLEKNLSLVKKYDWELKWSKWRNEKGNQFISIWEQDVEGKIRDTQIFAVYENKAFQTLDCMSEEEKKEIFKLLKEQADIEKQRESQDKRMEVLNKACAEINNQNK